MQIKGAYEVMILSEGIDSEYTQISSKSSKTMAELQVPKNITSCQKLNSETELQWKIRFLRQ